MTFELDPNLWAPQARAVQGVIDSNVQRLIVQGPTGSGKTRISMELFRYLDSIGKNGLFYVNRRLLIPQSHGAMQRAGLKCGVRAAEYDDMFDYWAPFQVCSADTEGSRVLKREEWSFHPGDMVIIDEAHLQKSKTMRSILDHYEERGARIVLLTATPVAMKDWADDILITGTMSEYRECNALVMAISKHVSTPDLRKIKRNATGEYIMDGEKKKIWTQTIVGDVIEKYEEYNPDRRPMMLYAPGKLESRWFVDQFAERGHRLCHIDANEAYFDGKRRKLNRKLWGEVVEQVKDGSFHGISNRFKCLDKETEILTSEGWVGTGEMTEHHEVFQFDHVSFLSGFAKPKKVIRSLYSGEMHVLTGSLLDARVTHNHEMLLIELDGLTAVEAQHCAGRLSCVYPVPHAFGFRGDTTGVWGTEKVQDEPVWCVTTDLGSILTRRNGKVLAMRNCREGIDIPEVYHLILATPIGSLASYVQTGGRALRYSESTPDHVIVQDHGGCYHTHDSLNIDRPWDLLWRMSEHVASSHHKRQIKNRDAVESIVCPECHTERRGGISCPTCSFQHKASVRKVVQDDGTFVEKVGNLYVPPKRIMRTETEKNWAKMFWGYRRKGVDRTFYQMEAFFCKTYGHYPPRDLPFMPKHPLGWYDRPCDIQMRNLIPRKEAVDV